jgi:hypothetical protein
MWITPVNFTHQPSPACSRTLVSRLIYRPIARPHFGGHVERLVGTTMGGRKYPARNDIFEVKNPGPTIRPRDAPP